MTDDFGPNHGADCTDGCAGRDRSGRAAGAVPALFAALLAILGALAAAQAEGNRNRPKDFVAQQFNRPIYDPESKSYFELRDDNIGGSWGAARRKAAGLTYKGTRGRLAVINSPETHEFLRRNFKLKVEAWIGLRYWCAFRKLQWVTGDFHTRQNFNVWAAQWYRHPDTKCGTGTATGPGAFMPVYYRPQNYRWQASGPAKHFSYYFVEYPTGAE